MPSQIEQKRVMGVGIKIALVCIDLIFTVADCCGPVRFWCVADSVVIVTSSTAIQLRLWQ